MIDARPVRPADRTRVEEMTAQVWDGHDYLPRVFDSWVGDPGAWFTAGEREGVVVAVHRVRPLSAEVAWYEGLRVAPEARRQGVARAMLADAVRHARGLGFQELRLATAEPDAMALFRSAGFDLLLATELWRAGRVEGDEGPALASPADAERIWRQLEGSPGLASYAGVVADGDSARELGAPLLAELAGRGEVRWTAQGRAVATCHVGWGGERLWVGFLAGSGQAVRDLLLGLRFEADADGLEGVNLWLPPAHPNAPDAEATGYDATGSPFQMHYYRLRI